jgi:ComF family protein
VGVYSSVLRAGIHALKYRGVRGVADPLGQLAARAYGAADEDALVVPVPSRRRRVAVRGVDHARLLAVVVAREVGRLVVVDALERCRRTRPQVGLDPTERRRNVLGAFRATSVVAGHAVILVDDVMTTGATAEACAEALLIARARVVDVCTVARAVAAGHGRDLHDVA